MKSKTDKKMIIGGVVGVVLACGLWFLAGLIPEFSKNSGVKKTRSLDNARDDNGRSLHSSQDDKETRDEKDTRDDKDGKEADEA